MTRHITGENSLLKSIFLFGSAVFIAGFVASGAGYGANETARPGKTRLVVMVVIDQLRADMVSRLERRFGENGFKYLIDKGTWYKNARFRYATTLTAVGHASIFTGAPPAQNGIVGNFWYDREAGRVVKSTAQSIRPTSAGEWRTPPDRPCGPYQLTSSTIGDELVMASNSRSRVFSVSFKDRGAILAGGYLGKAFWFGNDDFKTDDYYYQPENYPAWFTDWSSRKRAAQYQDKSLELLQEESAYIFSKQNQRFEAAVQKMNPQTVVLTSFPHQLPASQDGDYFKELSETPFLDDLTVEFACHVLRREKLGQGEFVDMLTVSLSGTDVIGHKYGPDSLEYEDNVLRVDRALAILFSAIDQSVGLTQTLIVVSADHGVASIPEYMGALGVPGEKLDPGEFAGQINRAIREKFAVPDRAQFVLGFWNPSIFLDEKQIADFGLSVVEVERVAADALFKSNPGIAAAITRTDMLQGNVPDAPLLADLKTIFHPRRSGNVLIIQAPFHYLYHETKDAAMHGSPYNYDTHVPMFFAGLGIPRQEVYRLVSPEEIAVTVALELGIQAPPAASGNALTEVLGVARKKIADL